MAVPYRQMGPWWYMPPPSVDTSTMGATFRRQTIAPWNPPNDNGDPRLTPTGDMHQGKLPAYVRLAVLGHPEFGPLPQ